MIEGRSATGAGESRTLHRIVAVHVGFALLTLFPGRVGGSESNVRGLLGEFGAGNGPERVTVLANRHVAEAYGARGPGRRCTRCAPTVPATARSRARSRWPRRLALPAWRRATYPTASTSSTTRSRCRSRSWAPRPW